MRFVKDPGPALAILIASACLILPGGAVLLRADEPDYAGGAACLKCHEDIAERGRGSAHFQIDCESCHGPLGRHAKDPSAQKGAMPDNSVCLMCHEAGRGMPSSFPQVDPRKHSGGKTCTSCHPAHHPEEGETKKR